MLQKIGNIAINMRVIALLFFFVFSIKESEAVKISMYFDDSPQITVEPGKTGPVKVIGSIVWESEISGKWEDGNLGTAEVSNTREINAHLTETTTDTIQLGSVYAYDAKRIWKKELYLGEMTYPSETKDATEARTITMTGNFPSFCCFRMNPLNLCYDSICRESCCIEFPISIVNSLLLKNREGWEVPCATMPLFGDLCRCLFCPLETTACCMDFFCCLAPGRLYSCFPESMKCCDYDGSDYIPYNTLGWNYCCGNRTGLLWDDCFKDSGVINFGRYKWTVDYKPAKNLEDIKEYLSKNVTNYDILEKSSPGCFPGTQKLMFQLKVKTPNAERVSYYSLMSKNGLRLDDLYSDSTLINWWQ